MPSFDLKHSLRNQLRSPSFSLTTVLTLALGIGASTAIFSLVYGVLIKPLPYPQSDRLVDVSNSALGIGLPAFEQSDVSYFLFQDQNQSFQGLGLYLETAVNLTGDGEPERLDGARITATLLPTLGVTPQLGRDFTPEELAPDGPPAAVLSHSLWQRRFGSDTAVLGRRIEINAVPHEVVGVMPAGFSFPESATQVWLPLALDRANTKAGNFNYGAVGRLRDGTSVQAAKADLDALVWRLPEASDGEFTRELLEKAEFQTLITPLHQKVVGDVGQYLWILLGTVGFILLIAYANVGNLFLVRAEGRRREIATRSALGAGRGHLLGYYLSESMLLALVGGAGGLVLAAVAVEALKTLSPGNLPRLEEVGLYLPVLGFTLLLSVLTAGVFGVVPALRAGGASWLEALKGGSRSTSSREANRVRGAMVIGQMALALVLLVGSGLMVRSFVALSEVDPGFDSESALTLRLSLPRAKAQSPEEGSRFYTQLLDRLEALPGVRRSAAASELPLTGNVSRQAASFEDFPRQPDELPKIFVFRFASHGYFEAMGIPVVAGRTFERRDHEQATAAAVVSQALAESLWPGQSPLGKRLRPGDAEDGGWYTIVGVVGATPEESLTEEPTAMVYYPMVGTEGDDWVMRTMTVVVRTEVPPLSLADAVRGEIWALNPDLPVANVQTLDAIVSRSTARTTFTLVLLSVAAGLALMLGAVGLYGVISYIVAGRTQEIGVRMALGAGRSDVSRMVLRQGLVLTAIGLAFGLAGALALTRLMASLLYGVSPTDPLTFTAVPCLLLSVALLATYLPARKAASVQPVEALKG